MTDTILKVTNNSKHNDIMKLSSKRELILPGKAKDMGVSKPSQAVPQVLYVHPDAWAEAQGLEPTSKNPICNKLESGELSVEELSVPEPPANVPGHDKLLRELSGYEYEVINTSQAQDIAAYYGGGVLSTDKVKELLNGRGQLDDNEQEWLLALYAVHRN